MTRLAIDDVARRAHSGRRSAGGHKTLRALAACVALGAAVIAGIGPVPARAALVADAPATVSAQAAAAKANAGPSSTNSAARHVNLAVYEGDDPPMDLLQAFDAVVLDPARSFDPSSRPLAHTAYLARVDDVDAHAASSASFVADQIAPLWQRGFRGFVLDTDAAIGALDAIRAAYPDAKIVLGGPHALDTARTHSKDIYAVLTRGLFTADSALDPETAAAPAAPSAAALDAARAFVRDTGIPVVTIESCDKTDRACARRVAHEALAAGLDAYVTDPAQDVVGIGRIEVMPRKVLVVQNPAPNTPLDLTSGVRVLATPLNYLGYDVQYVNAASPLPANVTPDRYAGVVAWIQGDVADQAAWRRWIRGVVGAHVPIAFLGSFGFPAGSGDLAGLRAVAGPFAGPASIAVHDPMVGFEAMPRPDVRDLPTVRVAGAGQSLLGIDAGGKRVDAVGVMPWGGFALNQYVEISLDSIEQERWVIQPIRFLQAALRLPALPGPSVTTENGRRLLMSHVDGDGFASRVEFPGSATYSAESLYDRIWTRYPIPVTLSVIEGEVGPSGLYPKISPRLEEIARKMYALPYVEIGSHTYSHPFVWEEVDAKSGKQVDRGGADAAFSLNIPGYKFNLDREIAGSIHYIDTRLAPRGKRVSVLQWSGDCMPPAVAVRRAYETGVFNINGGDTIITKSQDSWTNIAPIGVDKGPGAYQVYAPNQDENVYTNDWQGPFYGFEQVLQTYAMTDRPLRFKPIDLYYHMYSGTKLASLTALDHILAAVLAQPVLPVHITDYIRKVLDWHTFAVAREGNGWLVRGDGSVRELHWAGGDAPRMADAQGVTGYAPGPDGSYIHFDGGSAHFALEPASDARNTAPYIAEANGFVRDFARTAHGVRFAFGGYYKPFVKVANAAQCRATSGGRALDAHRDGAALTIVTPAVPGQHVTYQPIEVDCGE